MDPLSVLAAQQQVYQANLGMTLLRAQHQAQQTLLDMLAESAKVVTPANPAHLGQSIDTRA